ncbi:unnamed protein product [Caenorhabditis auriculariae]|uniref:DUF19 domain-containing protein n=1 Tax=Caenorhabditis auriculariae TaxID=2777116 RepID=A0A8S1HAR6_9PELO|nr:unnamed protein product [Caenorhabditis auriculariae]
MRSFFLLSVAVAATVACPSKEYLPCIVQLSAQKVPFDVNILNVVYNITTEAKLMHTCKTYERVFPCFEQRTALCGTKSQKTHLERSKRLHSYLCAPFLFRESCGEKDFMCKAKVDLSQMSTCTYLAVEKNCGGEAALFFAQMQQVLTNKEYPVQCTYSPSLVPITSKSSKKGLPIEPLRQYAEDYEASSFVTAFPKTAPEVPKNSQAVRRADPKKNSRNQPLSTMMTFTVRTPTIKSVNSGNAVPAQQNRTKFFHGAQPIPETSIFIPPLQPINKFKPNPYATQKPTQKPVSFTFVHPNPKAQNLITKASQNKALPVTTPSYDGKYVPWSFKADQTTTEGHPTLLTSTAVPILNMPDTVDSATQRPQEFIFSFTNGTQVTTPLPFKIEINWMNDDSAVETPWYQQSTPTVRDEPTQAPLQDHFSAVEPLINQLRSKSLNLTELGQQANSYFPAAISALTEKHASLAAQNDPWRAIIDAVAPTIQRVSPEIISRIREEIDRIQPPPN